MPRKLTHREAVENRIIELMIGGYARSGTTANAIKAAEDFVLRHRHQIAAFAETPDSIIFLANRPSNQQLNGIGGFIRQAKANAPTTVAMNGLQIPATK